MRVLCVDASNKKDCLPCDLVEGEVYTVYDVLHESANKYGKLSYHPVYRLHEMSKDYAYCIKRFIPLSDIDEMELVNTKEELHA